MTTTVRVLQELVRAVAWKCLRELEVRLLDGCLAVADRGVDLVAHIKIAFLVLHHAGVYGPHIDVAAFWDLEVGFELIELSTGSHDVDLFF